jgi:hypothetical protein
MRLELSNSLSCESEAPSDRRERLRLALQPVVELDDAPFALR